MRRTYRIAMLAACPFPANYGSPAAIREMSVTLAAMGHTIHLITYAGGDDTLSTAGIQMHRVGNPPAAKAAKVGPSADKPWLDWLMLREACRVIRRERLDIIHGHNYEGALIGAAAKWYTRKPLVYHAVNTMTDELHTYRFIRPAFVARGLARVLDAVTPLPADRVIAVTPEIQRGLIANRVPPERITMIPCGIEPELFGNADPARVRARYALGNHPIVMYTGVHSAFQRVDYLLRAFAVAHESCPEALLMVVSPLEHEPDLPAHQALAAELGIARHVIWAGPHTLEELPGYLACADVTVVPRCDCPGHPIKLLNYMMAGKPAVCFAGAAKGVTHGHDAWIAPDHDWRALGEGIARLITDRGLAGQIGAEARRTAMENFDWRRLCERVEEVYQAAYLR